MIHTIHTASPSVSISYASVSLSCNLFHFWLELLFRCLDGCVRRWEPRNFVQHRENWLIPTSINHIITTRVRITTEGYIFSLFISPRPEGYQSPSHNTSTGPMSFPRGVPHLHHPIILPLVPCPFQGMLGYPPPSQVRDRVPPGQGWGTPG